MMGEPITYVEEREIDLMFLAMENLHSIDDMTVFEITAQCKLVEECPEIPEDYEDEEIRGQSAFGF